MKQLFTLLFFFILSISNAQTVRLVKELTPGNGSSEIKIMGSFEEKIIFRVIKNDGWDMMISDASETNTKVLKSFTSDESFIKIIKNSASKLVVATSKGWNTTFHDVDIAANTLETKCSFSLFGPCMGVIKFKNNYWAIGDGTLWKLDTVACTANGLFADDEMFGLEIYNDHLYTVAAAADAIYLAKTDGTFLGTEALRNFSATVTAGPKFIEFNKLKDKLTVTIDNNHSGDGLYITDGTEDGTQLLKKFSWSDNSENASDNLMEVADDKLYFAARPQSKETGFRELYVSDGSPAGTKKIDFTQDNGMDPKFLTAYNNELYFYGGVNSKIYKSSGLTPVLAYDDDFIQNLYGAGTKYGNFLVPFNDKLIYAGISPTFGNELMESGPATSGLLLYNFSSGSTGIEPEQMTPAGNKLLYFVGKNSTSGKELFVYEPKITSSTLSLKGKEINVFPNPTSGIIMFPKEFSNCDVIVADANGNKIINTKLILNQLNLSDLMNGLYFLTVTDKTAVYTAKIVKQ